MIVCVRWECAKREKQDEQMLLLGEVEMGSVNEMMICSMRYVLGIKKQAAIGPIPE